MLYPGCKAWLQYQSIFLESEKMKTKLVWATQDGEKLLAYMARVSNPENQENHDTAERLIRYLWNNKHFSPFEMVDACFEIETTRDIARQMLRHRSFFFQEFSQRYANARDILSARFTPTRECRLQDTKNRQNSLPCNNETLAIWWHMTQNEVFINSFHTYQSALDKGIAKEVARALLPEGLTPTRMYMKGSLRSWLHYIELRTDPATQKEHREVAESICRQLADVYPVVEILL